MSNYKNNSQGTLIVNVLSAVLSRNSMIFDDSSLVLITVGGRSQNTQVSSFKGSTPSWQEIFDFNINGENMLSFQLYKETFSRDNLIGIKGVESIPCWRNGDNVGELKLKLEFIKS